MANFEPPSFALELDFEAPSFSLGLDFDFDWELQRTVKEDLASESRRRCSTKAILRKILENDDDFESPKMGRNPQVLDQNRPLKRLCPPTITRQPPAAKQKMHLEMHNFDEKIEEFSSQEQQRRANKRPSAQHHSVYNSSKLPLHGRHRVLSTQSTGCLRARERKWVMNSQASTDVGTSSNKLVFSKSTVSPLRRFPLIDSDTDSDDLPVCVDKNTEANILNSLIKRRHSNTEDLWKDFSAEKGFQIKTPALDEVCEECFRSMKKKRTIPNDNKGCHRSSNVDQSRGQICDLSDCRLPAHRYFFHEDPRIRNLVRTRLPNFFPLGVQDDRGNKHSRAPAIDYMSQFNHGEGSKKVAGKNNAQMGSTKSRKGSKKVACKNDAQMGSTKSGKGSKKVASKNNAQKGSTKSRKNSKKKNSEEVLPGSGSWVNPNSRPEIPKDAGKGRVPAVGRSSQSTGHWYTIPGGKKAYVSKNGQELIGRTAYGQYKKEIDFVNELGFMNEMISLLVHEIDFVIEVHERFVVAGVQE